MMYSSNFNGCWLWKCDCQKCKRRDGDCEKMGLCPLSIIWKIEPSLERETSDWASTFGAWAMTKCQVSKIFFWQK